MTRCQCFVLMSESQHLQSDCRLPWATSGVTALLSRTRTLAVECGNCALFTPGCAAVAVVKRRPKRPFQEILILFLRTTVQCILHLICDTNLILGYGYEIPAIYAYIRGTGQRDFGIGSLTLLTISNSLNSINYSCTVCPVVQYPQSIRRSLAPSALPHTAGLPDHTVV